jgi:hypothetical protein
MTAATLRLRRAITAPAAMSKGEHPGRIDVSRKQERQQCRGDRNPGNRTRNNPGKILNSPQRDGDDARNIIKQQKVRVADAGFDGKIIGKRHKSGSAQCNPGAHLQVAGSDNEAGHKTHQ